MAKEILSKRNFFDFESPDSAISRFPMTLIKSMVSLHQGPKVSKAKPLNMEFEKNCYKGVNNFYLLRSFLQ
jgi:hypothetical protein